MSQKIDKAKGPSYFEYLSKTLIGKRVEIEVASLGRTLCAPPARRAASAKLQL